MEKTDNKISSSQQSGTVQTASANLDPLKSEMNNRDTALDNLKFIASLMVVLAHCLNHYTHSGILYNALWLIQMPLFIIVSGMLSPSIEKADSIKKVMFRLASLAKRLLYPCLTFLMIDVLLGSFGQSVISGLVAFYDDPNTNLWFLWVLFFIETTYLFGIYFSSKFKHKVIRAIAPYIFAILVFTPLVILILKGFIPGQTLGIRLFVFYLPFYCIGSFGKGVKTRFFGKHQGEKKTKAVGWVVFASLAAIFIFEIFYFDSIYSFSDSSIIYLAIRIIGSLSGCYILIFLSYKIKNIRFIKTASKGGQYSLECYYLHILFVKLVDFDYMNSILPAWSVVLLVWIFLVSMVASFLVFCYFVPFLHALLFGKSWSYYSFEKQLFNRLQNKKKTF